VHCDIFDQLSPSAMPTWLPAQLSARSSTTPTPCCMEHHLRTLIAFDASNMRWLNASWTRKLIEARMRCYINYTGCLSIIVLTLNLRNAFLARSSSTSSYLNSLVARYLSSHTLRSQPSRRSQDKDSLSVRAHSMLLWQPFLFLPMDIRSTDSISTFCGLLKTFYFHNAFNQQQWHHPHLRFTIFGWHCVS